MSFKRPPLKVFIEFVQRYDKRVGLRKLYRDYEIPAEMRPRFRQMWDKIAEEVKYASEKRETTSPNGDGPPQSGEGQPEKSGSIENEPKATPRVHSDKRNRPQKQKKKKKAKKKKALKS